MVIFLNLSQYEITATAQQQKIQLQNAAANLHSINKYHRHKHEGQHVSTDLVVLKQHVDINTVHSYVHNKKTNAK